MHPSRRIFFFLALAFAALAAAPLFADPGFLLTRGGGDSSFLLVRLHQLLAALQAGEFPVRWMPDAALGYGYPFFSYYAAFPFYLAAGLKLYGFSYVTALKLTQLIALLIGAAGAYLWARSVRLPSVAALTAAAAYTFAPFHLVNLYVRGDSLSELWAMGLYPLILWRAQRCLDQPNFKHTFVLALFVGALSLSHNISALNFMPFLALYLAIGAVWPLIGALFRQRVAAKPSALAPLPPRPVAPITAWARLILPGLALAWGLALAAFFWLPALRETDAVQITGVSTGYFFYGNHFRSANLVQPNWVFSFNTEPGHPTPFSMGLWHALIICISLLVLPVQAWRAKRWPWQLTFALLAAGLATWMVTPASQAAWEQLPLVSFTQFPWRFLSLQGLFAALFIGAAMGLREPETAQPSRANALQAGVALALASTFALTTLPGLQLSFVPLTDAEVNPQTLQLFEYFSGNLGSTAGYEYLPRATNPRPFASATLLERPPQVKTLSGAATGTRTFKNGAHEQWVVAVSSDTAAVAFPTYYWPGWEAWVDGTPTPVRAAVGLGWITLDVPAGQHQIDLRLGRTPLRLWAELLSLAALVPAAVWAFLRRKRIVLQVRRYLAPLVLGAGALLVGSVGLRLAAAQSTPTPAELGVPLSQDFAQLALAHRAPVVFANGNRLVTLTYSANSIAPGETLTLTMQWLIQTPTTVTVQLVPNANLIAPQPITLTQAIFPLAPASVITLAIPADIPPGLYFTALATASPALTSAGQTRGWVYLNPLQVEKLPEAQPDPNAAPFVLQAVALESLPPATARVHLTWQTNADLTRNYALNLRLRDIGGNEWAGWDTQVGYGMYPSSLWRLGEVVREFYDLPLPPGAPPGEYRLGVTLYDAATLDNLLEEQYPVTLTIASPLGERAAQWTLTPALALSAVDFPDSFEQGTAPELGAHWLALAPPATLYRAQWSLVSPNMSVTQTLDLAPGSDPRQWPAPSYIRGRVRFGTGPDLKPGPYTLVLQLVDEKQQPLSDAVAVRTVTVTGRDRTFTLPPLQTPFTATFGQSLQLYGYDAVREGQMLNVTLAWGARTAPGADYKYFVHLLNPADESVPLQVDTAPRNFTYATALWAAGEVVTDTISFDLSLAPPGNYVLAIGWYPPDQPYQRLPAFDAAGQPLPFDRVILPLEVEVP